jgi:hypothetical protein
MTQNIIDVGVDANDGTGESLRQAFTEVNDNFTKIFTSGPVDSDVKIYGNTITTVVTNQNLVLQANGIGSIQSNSTIIPGTPGVYDLGAPTNTFQYAYANYFVGNGRMLTGIGASYSNIDVAKFLIDLDTPIKTSANVQTGNIITVGTIAASGNIIGAGIVGSSINSNGTITAVGNISGGVLLGTAANLSGNVVAGYFVGNGSLLTGITADSATQIIHGNSNVNISLADANIVVGVAGVSNVATFTTTGLSVANAISANSLTAISNVISGNVIANNTIAGRNLQIENIQVSANGNVSLGNVNIHDVATPVADSDAATKLGAPFKPPTPAPSTVRPSLATPGMLWFDTNLDQLNVYVDSSIGWQPVTAKHIRYNFSNSTQWLVTHNRNTTKYSIVLTDSDGYLFFAKVNTIDSNSFEVFLTAETSGYVDVTFM